MRQNMRPKAYLSLEQMVELLMSMDHAAPIGIVTRTEPKMRKTGNEYYGRITKITDANVFVNCRYEDAVNRALAREGKESNFVAGERAVAMTRISDGPKPTCILHMTRKDGMYCRYIEVHYRGHLKSESRFLLDGRSDIQKAEFREFMSESSGSAGQGLLPSNEIVVRTYDVRNIIELRTAGTDYVVIR